MANLTVEIISRETIKPSSPNVQSLDPFKISYFDQLTPTTYVPFIVFYSGDGVNPINTSQTLTRLKKSLSKSLDIYYPFSGRTRDNIVVDSFHEGVPFLVARVNCRVVEFVRTREIESLNKFVPCQPFDKEKDMGGAIATFQVNVFSCGGIAIGICFSHKHGDATTLFANFVKTWAALSRGSSLDKSMYANLANASTVFPPRNQLPQNYSSLMDALWFSERKLVTRRFIFDAKSITTLRNKAKGEEDQALPSRIQAITGFIWKCYMAASRITSGTTKASLLVQAVNMRPRSTSRLLDGAIGNLFWWGVALASPADHSELSHLVVKMEEGVTLFDDDDYLKSLQGKEGFEVMSNLLDQLEDIISIEKPDVLAFTSWCYQGVYEFNFGFGEPVWAAVMGKAGPEFRNMVVIFETKWGKGIEAWITLDETRMAALEQDPEFLAFASPNPGISSL